MPTYAGQDALEGLTQIVRAKRGALTALARNEGLTPEDAVDCVQEGLCTLLDLNQTGGVDPRADPARRAGKCPCAATATDASFAREPGHVPWCSWLGEPEQRPPLMVDVSKLPCAPVFELHCESVGDVAPALLTLIDSGVDTRIAIRAAYLLATLAPPSCAAALLELARDRSRNGLIRTLALQGFAAVSGVAPVEAIRELLNEHSVDEAVSSHRCAVCDPHDSLPPRLIDTLRIVRGKEHEEVACDWLGRATPAILRAIIESLESERDERSMAKPVLDRLATLWCDAVATAPSTSDARLATRSMLRARPESERVLIRYWQSRPKDNYDFFKAWIACRSLESLVDDTLRSEGVRRLVFPLPELLATFGASGLRRVVEEAIRDMAGAGLAWPLTVMEGKDDETEKRMKQRYRRALQLLKNEKWTDAAPIAVELLREDTLPEVIREHVTLALFQADRELALRTLVSSPRWTENLSILRLVLEKIARAPLPIDREFLRELAQVPDDRLRYRVIDALETLGEDDDTWVDLLRAMARAEGQLLCVRAHGALARRGDRVHENALAKAAQRAETFEVREEATCRLGELDHAAQYFAIFQQGIFIPSSVDDEEDASVGLQTYRYEAAIALRRVESPEALTLFLRACLLDLWDERFADCQLATRLVEWCQGEPPSRSPRVRALRGYQWPSTPFHGHFRL